MGRIGRGAGRPGYNVSPPPAVWIPFRFSGGGSGPIREQVRASPFLQVVPGAIVGIRGTSTETISVSPTTTARCERPASLKGYPASRPELRP